MNVKRLVDPAVTFETAAMSFRWQVPARFNIAEAVSDRHARNKPDEVALFYENEAGYQTRLTFGEINSYANQLAHVLKNYGVSVTDRVALILPQRAETGIVHIAAHKIGAVSLPLSVQFGPDALKYRLADSGSRVVVTDGAHAETILALSPELPDLELVLICSEGGTTNLPDLPEPTGNIRWLPFWQTLQSESPDFTTQDTSADDPALLIYTSGTTGPPKGALVAHRSLIGNLTGFEMSLDFFPQAGDVFFTPADWAWTGGLFDGLLPTWFYGMPIVGYEYRKFQPEPVLTLLERHQVTVGFFPPTALKMLRSVEKLNDRYDLKLRALMSAGEMVGEELLNWGQEVLGASINEMYGQTEHNYMVGNCHAAMAIKPGSMGKAYPGHQVTIMRDDGSLADDEEIGEIVAHRDDAVHFLGYWNNQQATRNKYSGDWFHTGDTGYRDTDGYLWFVGRTDDVITSAGYRIGPGEIEDCILQHPAVLQVAVIGVPDPDEIRGDVVKACIVLKHSDHTVDRQATRTEIQAIVRERLAAYEYPRIIEFLDALPMTTTGKVRRMVLREQHAVSTSETPGRRESGPGESVSGESVTGEQDK